MENVPPAASSPQTDSFPAGLRVLVVDDDPTWLKILEKMLKRCCYEGDFAAHLVEFVTTCCLAREALNMLRERKDGFDIVISDVNMPDMDGFKLLEYVGLEMDLPVIMMSVDGETSRVMKGVQHGACDYLLKPVRMKELKNIWQHVLRKRIHEVKEIESYECIEDVQMRNRSNKFEDGYSPCGNGLSSRKKRNDSVNKEQDSQDNDPSCGKKSRVLWSVELHQKFVNAVDQIGLDKVGPKKILDLMNVPWLTRENVASHLQKYRLYLHRLQRHSESNTPFGIIKQFDFPSKDSPTCFSLQSSSTELQTRASSCTFGYSDSSIQVQDSLDIHGGGSIISVLPKEKPRNFLIDDLPDSKKRKSGSPNGQDHSFSSQKIDINYDAFGSSVHQRHSWSKEIPTVMLTQRVKQEHEPRERTHTLPSPEIDIQSDDLQFSSSNYTGTSFSGRNKVCASESKHLCTEYGNNYVKNVSPVAHITGCLSVQSEREMEDLQQFGPISTIGGSVSSMQNYGSDQKKASSLEFDPQYLLCGSESPFQSSNDAVQLFSFQGLGCVDNFGLTNVEYLDDYDLRLFTEIPSQSFDKVILNCQYLSDSMEYPIIDEALYVARPLSS